jgi:hypothetical protein
MLLNRMFLTDSLKKRCLMFGPTLNARTKKTLRDGLRRRGMAAVGGKGLSVYDADDAEEQIE